MTDAGKEARRAYKRQWAKANRDKVRASQARYWDKVAIRAATESFQERDGKPATDSPRRRGNNAI